MDLTDGFRIEDPPALIAWTTSEANLQALVGPGLRHVTTRYWTAPVTVLGGLRCHLGFHFRGRRGALSELEFYRDAYVDLAASYEEFQEHLERTFGPPARRTPGSEGFPTCRWTVPGGEIVHLVMERFGPEEHVRIRPLREPGYPLSSRR